MNTITEFDLGNLELLESLPEAEPIDEEILIEKLNELLDFSDAENMDICESDMDEEVMADKTEDLKSDLILSEIELREFQQKVEETMERIRGINAKIKSANSNAPLDVRIKTGTNPKCRFYERGYCKNRDRCKFRHPVEICEPFENHACDEDTKCQKRLQSNPYSLGERERNPVSVVASTLHHEVVC